MFQIILASNSPRRKEILEQVGISFTVKPSKSEEESTQENPIERVEEIADQKAKEVANTVTGPAIIIGADTIVVHEGKILGKPKNEQEAISMLTELSGTSHEVYTGVSIVIKDVESNDHSKINQTVSFVDVSKVLMHNMNRKQIEQYVKTQEPMDKAGAYAIQGRFAIYIKEIIGDYYNIVGLPISMLYQKLYELGINLIEQ